MEANTFIKPAEDSIHIHKLTVEDEEMLKYLSKLTVKVNHCLSLELSESLMNTLVTTKQLLEVTFQTLIRSENSNETNINKLNRMLHNMDLFIESIIDQSPKHDVD